ncbi:SDR family oxidoreductase [Streptomyces sp. R28]|uniref:SDR family oxidoreductase n=1 Tax=Streptomyces sp. R28 TaxID=3238628 RepID=A0AB39PR52_9ACTN
MPRLPHPALEALRRDPLPLRGRTALVTGAGRRVGIGHAVARRLAAYGASVHLHHHVPHDAAMPWGADRPEDVVAPVRQALGDPDAQILQGPGDLSAPAVPAELVAVDTRSVLLLAQAHARLRPAGPGGGVVMMTSGQDIAGGMPGEIAYALQKGALASSTRSRSLSTTLAERGITVNTVNPGPVDTDYLTGEAYEGVAAAFPAGLRGMPDDPARLVAWPATDEAGWITGEVINSEGGFRR